MGRTRASMHRETGHAGSITHVGLDVISLSMVLHVISALVVVVEAEWGLSIAIDPRHRPGSAGALAYYAAHHDRPMGRA